MKKQRRPHCSHVSHQIKCDCAHPHYRHADLDDKPESGRCLERPCRCESFKAAGYYRPEQLEHRTIPIEGQADTVRTNSGEIIHGRNG